jgi:hypothetical protein
MRARFVHVLAGVLLGTALAVLFSVPGYVLAREEPVPPVRAPLGETPTQGRAAGCATAGRQDRRSDAATPTSAPAEER